VSWRIVFTKQAQKDAKKLSASGLKAKAEKLIQILRENPYHTPPSYEKLVGDLSDCAWRLHDVSLNELVEKIPMQE
jgi:Txe/YoeB family toxin of toxin-antitoxin system